MATEAARDIATVSGGRIGVSVGSQTGSWLITPGGYVGTVVTPQVELLVRPKIPLHNLFLLLEVGVPSQAWQRESFAFGTDPNLLPAVASFFARTFERAVAAGLRRDYRPKQDRLIALRGRVDIAAQLHHPGIVAPIECRFDEYTADIAENRILRAAVGRLLRVPGVRAETRRSLSHELVRFDEVTDISVDPLEVDRIVFTRLNRHYEPALRLAQLVLRNMALLDRVGTADASAFLLDTPTLFQRWLTNRLRRHLHQKVIVDAEPRVHLGIGRKVPMEPDLVFRGRDHHAVFLADAKYKLSPDGQGRSADYYQLLAYLTALDLPEGVLVYCRAEGRVPEREVVVRHSQKRLWTYALPLTGQPRDVELAVAELAAWIVRRAEATQRDAVSS